MKVDASEYVFSETLKAEDIKEDKKVKILDVKNISTRFGEKRIAMLDDGTQIFLNSLSLQNIVDELGDETDDWKDKEIILSTESSDRTTNRKSIVVIVKEEQRYSEK